MVYSKIRALLLSWPRWLAVTAVTGASVVGSLVATTFLIVLTVKGEPRWFESVVIATVIPLLVATPVSYIVFRMMHELEAARSEALRLASIDLLTGALNRRRFFEVSERELMRASVDRVPTSVLLLDIDDFKKINDLHGHRTGDEVLRQVAHACRNSLRPADHFARWGGEEFVALLPGADTEASVGVALRLRSALAECADEIEPEVKVTASIGVASTELGVSNLERLIALADHAMYTVKRNGKDNVRAAAERDRYADEAA